MWFSSKYMFIFHQFKVAVLQNLKWWPHILKSAMQIAIGCFSS